MHARQVAFAVKRVIDVTVSAALLIELAPTFIAVALAIKLSSRGPVLLRTQRVGRNEHAFSMIKFRTMFIAPNRDRRRTRVGVFLRRSSLDELPQLLNVLRGEMSFIGPSPERPEHVELFVQTIPRYSDRHRVKPGLTGWAQVNRRRHGSLAEGVELDNYYVEHWSLGLDLKIAVLTLLALFRSPA